MFSVKLAKCINYDFTDTLNAMNCKVTLAETI